MDDVRHGTYLCGRPESGDFIRGEQGGKFGG
jgi:hypothetical protein